MSMREDLYRAAITCRHEITHDQIILYVDHRKEGNALSQLADRLEKSALASQAQQEQIAEDKAKSYWEALILSREELHEKTEELNTLKFLQAQEMPRRPRQAAYGVKSKYGGFDPYDGHKQLIGLSIGKPKSPDEDEIVKLFTEDQMLDYAKAFLASQAQQESKEQGEPCANSDSWNCKYCKYCRQTKTCKAIDDDRNYSGTVKPLPPAPEGEKE